MEQNKWLVPFLLSIFLFTLSIPPFGFNFFGWFALAPFYYVLLKSRHKVRDGLIYGIIFGSILYGLAYVGIYKDFNIKIWGVTSIILFQGLFYATHGFCVGLIQQLTRKKAGQYLLILLNWLVLEYIGNRVFLGFSMYAAMSQYRNYSLLHLAQYVGVYGVSGIVLSVNLLLGNILLTIQEKSFSRKKLYTYATLLLIIGLIIAGLEGNNRLIHHEELEATDQVEIALIQGNISDTEYRKANQNFAYVEEHFVKYLNLSKASLRTSNPQLIIWPETSIHLYMLRLPRYRDRLYQFAEEHQVHLLIGSQDLDIAGRQYNSVFLISPEGELVGRHDKKLLFPFTEKKFTAPEKPLQLLNWNDVQLGVNICFESNFPNHSATLARSGADLLIFLSNNGSFGLTRIPYFTSIFSVFRAVENRLYAVQTMNTGFTQVITPKGQVVNKTKLFTEDVVVYQLPINQADPTFYSRYGDFFYTGLTILFILIMLYLLWMHNPIKGNLQKPKQTKENSVK